ncbi:unnamed protein product [Nezara viridula]|uniref:Reverse transcriptase/retrotransposon-derived protein RNase H-like domain-containing protein n=1 Tax=Nezara viridula TaxID=85310 RepID=A0A9P0HK92_NEZVI|nr:unnamed protein product [Nezara viridula]
MNMLSRDLVFTHYNPELPLVITADTSPIGIVTILPHLLSDNASPGKMIEVSIAYASRAMTTRNTIICNSTVRDWQ